MYPVESWFRFVQRGWWGVPQTQPPIGPLRDVVAATALAWPCMIVFTPHRAIAPSSDSGGYSTLSLATNQLSIDSDNVNMSLFLLVPLT